MHACHVSRTTLYILAFDSVPLPHEWTLHSLCKMFCNLQTWVRNVMKILWIYNHIKRRKTDKEKEERMSLFLAIENFAAEEGGDSLKPLLIKTLFPGGAGTGTRHVRELLLLPERSGPEAGIRRLSARSPRHQKRGLHECRAKWHGGWLGRGMCLPLRLQFLHFRTAETVCRKGEGSAPGPG